MDNPRVFHRLNAQVVYIDNDVCIVGATSGGYLKAEHCFGLNRQWRDGDTNMLPGSIGVVHRPNPMTIPAPAGVPHHGLKIPIPAPCIYSGSWIDHHIELVSGVVSRAV